MSIFCRHNIISADEFNNYYCEECGKCFEQWACLLPDGTSGVRRQLYEYVGIRILTRARNA